MTSQLLKMNARLVSTSLTVYRTILSILESLSGELELVNMYLKCSSFTDASCDFDSDLCGWQNDQFDDFDWWRMKGSTATPNTGPRADHTSSNGQQM